MTPRDALVEVLDRVGAGRGVAVRVSEQELRQWPAEAVSAMQSHQLLVRAGPATAVVCPGCEEECVMPVQTLPAGSGPPARFIVCDKRSDINRVVIAAEQVNQWKCDAEAIARFVSEHLDLHRNSRGADGSGMLPLGLAAGGVRRQMVWLRSDGDVALVAADTTVPLAELVDFDGGDYALDLDAIRRLVDSATNADPRYTPSTVRRGARKLDTEDRYERWRSEYRALRKQRPNMSKVWYSQQLAKQPIADGRSADTIRKHLST